MTCFVAPRKISLATRTNLCVVLSSAVCCSQVKGCLPAMGYSFAAGTTDGPGTFTFRQGMKTENPLWNVVRNFLSPPTECDVECHAPKPILLATGQVRTVQVLGLKGVFFRALITHRVIICSDVSEGIYTSIFRDSAPYCI